MKLKVVLVALIMLVSGCVINTKPVTPSPYPIQQIQNLAVNPYPGPDPTTTPSPEPTVEFFPFPDGVQLLFPIFHYPAITPEPLIQPARGVEIWEGGASSSGDQAKILEINPQYVKLPIYWSHVEISKGVYVWPSNYGRSIAWIQAQGKTPIVTIKAVPDWAREPGSELCSRPLDVNDFAEFAGAVAAKYPSPIVLELGNEPDSEYGAEDYYGCWGDPAHRYNGGNFYRLILDASYPLIKQVNPNAVVLAGALMIDCLNCLRSEWIQAWGDSPNYDAVSFHSYTWTADITQLDATVDYLRQWTDKPLWITETAVRSPICNTAQEQRSVTWAKHVRDYGRVDVVIWFTLPHTTWECVSLLYLDQTHKPVWNEWTR